MKVQIVQPARTLVGVRDIMSQGIFLRYAGNPRYVIYLTASGCELCENNTLELILAESKERTPIYEGDTINIQF